MCTSVKILRFGLDSYVSSDRGKKKENFHGEAFILLDVRSEPSETLGRM
jgi:hypothetical protein